MGDPRWEVDEWGDLRFDGDVIYPSEGPHVLRAGYPFLVAAVRDADRVSTLRRLVYELAHGNRPRMYDGQWHWYSADEDREHHFLNQPLLDAEVAEWEALEAGE